MPPRIAIVLATYNGARHLQQQLESLRAQDHGDWHLFVRDDGSTDETPDLLAKLAREEHRATVLASGRQLGVIGNFAQLLSHAHCEGAEFVFPCDQDDVWMPTKMSRSLALMAQLEAAHGSDAPLLVHSDLRVVDENLGLIHPSFLRYQGIGHEGESPLHVLLVENFVTGCASVINRPLLELAMPIPGDCIMHDWWLAQCAAASGAIGFIPEPTILYRQHASNQIGAGGVVANLNFLRAPGRKRLARSWKTAFQATAQAGALLDRMRERGNASSAVLNLVEAYARIAEQSLVQRLATLRRFHIRRQRSFLTALLYVRVALFGVAAGQRPT